MRNDYRCNFCGGEACGVVWSESPHSAVRCAACGLVSLHPLPDISVSDVYGEAYYNDYYESVRDARRRHMASVFPADIPMPSGGRLLDVGCGPGIFLEIARERGMDVQGIDASPAAVACAVKHGLAVRQGPLSGHRFPDNHFQLVTFWDALAHFPDPAFNLREALRILTPGGVLFVKTPYRHPILFRLARRLPVSTRGLFGIPSMLYHFTPGVLARFLETAGFASIRNKPVEEFHFGRRHPDRVKHLMLKGFSAFSGLTGLPESFIIYAAKKA